MIVPMKKVSLVVQDQDQNFALAKLREIGIMHLEMNKTSSGKLPQAIERKAQVENALVIIDPFKTPKKKKSPAGQGSFDRDRRLDDGPRRGRRSADKLGREELEPFSAEAILAPDRPNLTDLMISMGNERKDLKEQHAALIREQGRIAPWGDFNPQVINELASNGIPVYLYELTPDVFASIPKAIRFIRISENKSTVRLLVFYNEIPEKQAFQLPEKSLSEINDKILELEEKIESLNGRIAGFADRRPTLVKELSDADSEVDFEIARSELEKIEGISPEQGISYLTGFVPADELGKIKAAAAEYHWALAAVDPGPDDNVPTKLKNNKVVNLLNPVTSFLGIVPGYNEVDISPWFLIFFCIFFAMIFGDAAYGLIFTVLALVGIIATAKKGVPQALQLLLLLGLFNTTWGVLTCSWFGMDSQMVPQFLQNLSLSYISTAKADGAIVDQNLQLFCFSLALVHLSIARIKGVFRYIKSLKVFAEIGMIGMLAGMYNVVLFLVVSNEQRTIPLLPVSIYLLAGGFALSFVFASYEGNIVQSILSSCKNFISVVLGITNVFSDIMSYIRLWAVGLAGASIATTVNTMAGPLLGNFLIFAGIILLVFGHGLNLILNVLSVLVHGVRLNTLEFSGHVGLAWSGTPYRPFMKKGS